MSKRDEGTAGAGEQGGATLAGFIAILIWSSLSLLTYWSGQAPPLQLVAMSFFIAFLIGLADMARKGVDPALKALSPAAILIGVGGLFGYHFLFFLSLRLAPVVEATLINYLWPLLIVLFSALLPGRLLAGRLGWHHVAGALLGFCGVGLFVLAKPQSGGGTGETALVGYLVALGAALAWSSYSVASRLFAHVPTQAVTLYCLLTALLAAVAHLLMEETHWPGSALQWLAVLGLGLGPVGGAFYFWDRGMKRGDVRLLGVSSYFAPLMSVVLLILFGVGKPGLAVALAALLITGGALLAAKDQLAALRRRKRPAR